MDDQLRRRCNLPYKLQKKDLCEVLLLVKFSLSDKISPCLEESCGIRIEPSRDSSLISIWLLPPGNHTFNAFGMNRDQRNFRWKFLWSRFIPNALFAYLPSRHNFMWTISDTSPKFCSALWEYFFDVETIKISCGSLIKEQDDRKSRRAGLSSSAEESCALAFIGNVFGIPEQDKSWNELSSYVRHDRVTCRLFGESTVNKIKETIKSKYHGEAPLYSSFVVPTTDASIKYIIYVAGYHWKKPESYTFAYNATYSSLICLHHFNQCT